VAAIERQRGHIYEWSKFINQYGVDALITRVSQSLPETTMEGEATLLDALVTRCNIRRLGFLLAYWHDEAAFDRLVALNSQPSYEETACEAIQTALDIYLFPQVIEGITNCNTYVFRQCVQKQKEAPIASKIKDKLT
jgi:hypothetical protein